MAEGKRIYEIKINGLEESYEGVKSLREALNTLSDTVVNVSKEEQKISASRKETAAGTDALAKATQKLNEWDRSYQTELALVNKELSDNKKEIKDAIKLQEAQATVDAKQLDTYTEKQHYLSALNTLIRNHSTATEEDRAAIDRMVQESAQLQAELKATDEQMKIYVRNVGNYPGAAEMVVESHKSLKQELKELKTEMAEMLASGVSKTDEAYLKLAERAGQLKDAMGDANQDIANFASDTRGLTNAINLATSAVNAYQLYNSALQVFGGENEEAAKSMQKMMAVMTLLNSLQQVQNSLLENGSLTGRLYTKAVELIQAALGLKKTATEADIATTEASTAANEANAVSQEANAAANEASAVAEGVETAATEANTVATGANTGALGTNTGALGANATASQGAAAATNSMSVAQKAGAVASKTLSVALRAIPLMAIIGLVMALIQNWESIWNWFKKTFPVLDTLSKKFNKFGGLMNAIVTGAKAVAAAVVNWLINPFKTFANVVGKILEGDFSGAWQAALDGVKNQFKGTVDAFMGEVQKGFARGQDEMTAKSAAESNKRTKQELAELKIQERNNKTYSKKYIELQKKDFEERKKMAKGNQEELNKIKLEEMQFYADVEDKNTNYLNEQAKERTKKERKATQDRIKQLEQIQQQIDAHQAKITQDIEDNLKVFEDASMNALKLEEQRIKNGIDLWDEENNRLTTNVALTNKTIDNNEKRIKLLEGERDILRRIYDLHPSELLKQQISDINTELSSLKKNTLDIIGDLNTYETELSNSNTMYESAYADRLQIVMEYFQKEQEQRKKNFKKEIEDLQENIDYLQEVLDNGQWRNSIQKANIEWEIEQGKKQIEQFTKVMEEEFGKYADTEIEIPPIQVDFEQVKESFNRLSETLRQQGEKMPIGLLELTNALMGVTEKTSDQIRTIEEVWNDALKGGEGELNKLAETLIYVLNLSEDKVENLYEIVGKNQPFEKIKLDLMEILSLGNFDLNKFGTASATVIQNIRGLMKDYASGIDSAYNDLVSKQDKIISNNEKLIKNFQDATKNIKFEPVMQDDALTKFIKGQILNMDETRERYDNLRDAYIEYRNTVEEGSEEMQKVEDAWQIKLEATKQKYGENSIEYRLMVDEKEKSDAAYALEYEKVTQQIEEIDKKSARIREDYFESLHKRMSEIYSAFNDNVFQPIAEGFGALIDFQLEEAQEALERVEKLYDKAVEAREESAERLKQINEELRADEGQNKEALQQRLAEEEVLLVQREENERALQKEKEKREAEVERKEKQQRKLELGQKLLEGIANTALGATAALKYGFPLGPVFAAIITAMGALQTAIIAKQISKLEKGGKVGEQGVSRSHKQGGHRIEGTNIEVEGQEWVINKKSSQKYDTLLRAINEDNPRLVRREIEIIREKQISRNTSTPFKRLFADGGRINTLTAANAVRDNNEIAAITDLIKQIDFEPTVSVVDINRKNKNLVRVQQYAGKAG